jgi:endonuclease/exonuclease/phosphatase family metal-dependent hydrolase
MSTQGSVRRIRSAALVAAMSVASVAVAAAQTTVVLNVPGTQVTDTTLRGGASANANFNKLDSVSTSANTNYDEVQRALVKFDTENTMPARVKITSAILTLTLKSGGSDSSRTVSVFPVTTSWVQEEATWNRRRAGLNWTTAGGDFGPLATRQTVSNVAAAKVNVDVTAVVQAAVSGVSSSRYTRIGLVDQGASSSGSIRQFYSSKALDPSVRPVLRVVYGGDVPAAPVPPPPPPPLPTGTLRVLQYNTHHGGWGTDGVYDPNRIVAWIVKANADIVSMNEIEVGTSWSNGADQTTLYQSLLQKATGRTWYKKFMFNRTGTTSGNGNLILSRYPFIATANNVLPLNRCAVDVTVSVNGRTVNFTSTHLDNVSSSNRQQEIADLLPWETTLAEQRLVLGDFNAWPDTTEITNMKTAYTDTWLTAKAMGTAIGNGITHGTSSRIDYVFQSKSATYLTLTSVQIFDTADASGVKPSDHEPVLAVFQVK